ncbi:MAG TPA: FkbM family methyltransferase [Azospirillaceae bacterium]|nr:FkbM family methyltransferase [Azospirillaceae bacterium]
MKKAVAAALEAVAPAAMIRYRLWKRHAHYEKELWLVPQWARRDSVAIDVGGNAGIWALQLARFAGHVHSFEPNPLCLRQLRRLAAGNVTVHDCALSDRAGEATLRFDPGNTGIGTIEGANPLDRVGNPGIRDVVERRVPVRTLDSFAFNRVAFVKIDVEGHELPVLQGAADLIRRCRPVLLVEIEERHNPGSFARVVSYLEAFGYRCHAVDPRTGAVAPFTGRPPAAADHAALVARGAYVNNFIFLS